MKRDNKLIETGIENLKIMPDPNDTILYIVGKKWYSWICTIQLSDSECDRLIEVLQIRRSEKASRAPKLIKIEIEEIPSEPQKTAEDPMEAWFDSVDPMHTAYEEAVDAPSEPEQSDELALWDQPSSPSEYFKWEC